jgi:hypothetical protein
MKAFVILFCAALTSCASIVSHTHYPVRIDSAPDEASFSVVNRKGKEVATGVTPQIVTLKAGNGYFKKGIYTIHFNKPGYKESFHILEAHVNGWYFGNFGFGGVIGFLIVDPATGAMYRLPGEVTHIMKEDDGEDDGGKR